MRLLSVYTHPKIIMKYPEGPELVPKTHTVDWWLSWHLIPVNTVFTSHFFACKCCPWLCQIVVRLLVHPLSESPSVGAEHTHTETVVFMESLGFKSESDLPYLTLITVYDSQLRRWAGSAYLSVFFKGRGCGEKGRMWTGVNVQQTGFIMGLGIQCCQCLSKGRWTETLQFI